MADIEVLEYILFSAWGSALVNGDYSGLNDDDEQAIKEFLEREKPGYCVGMSDDEWFAWRNDTGTGLGGTVATFYFHKEAKVLADVEKE